MGIFGRSEAQERQQLQSSFDRWFDWFYATEAVSQGTRQLSPLVIERMADVAFRMALNDTYRRGQVMRVSDWDMDWMRRDKIMFALRRNVEERLATAKKSTAKKSTAKKSTAKKSTAKKSTAKKSTAKKSTAKKSTAKKSTAKRIR